MIRFYRNVFFTILILLALSAILIGVGYECSKLTTRLYPNGDPEYRWQPVIEPETPVGDTWISVKGELNTIDYEYFLDPEQSFPYTHYSLDFVDEGGVFTAVDLSRYDRMSFDVLCDPKNVLLVAVFSFDEKVTDLADLATRRVSSSAFSCDSQWQTSTIHFEDIATPDWWLSKFGYKYSDKRYAFDKVMGIAFINSLQSPIDTHSRVRLTKVMLLGEQAQYLNFAIFASIVLWIAGLAFLMRHYIQVLTADIREKLRLDLPLVAYKKLTIEPQKDKEKSLLLRHMATEYASPELSLEASATALGINRTKINDMLKEELGLTFTAYLNKLRLTEAARLLSEKDESTVSEIAYSVGYNNVSYFNKLFKNEYGCTPKTFKNMSG